MLNRKKTYLSQHNGLPSFIVTIVLSFVIRNLQLALVFLVAMCGGYRCGPEVLAVTAFPVVHFVP